MMDRVLQRLQNMLVRASESIGSLATVPDDDRAVVEMPGATQHRCCSEEPPAGAPTIVAPAFPDPWFPTDEPEVDRLRRVAASYFDVVRRMEHQRDEWRDMFLVQSREHHQAQVQLQEQLGRVARVARALVRVINQYRVGQGLPEYGSLAEIEREMPDLASAYEARMRTLVERSEPLLSAEQELADLPST